MKPRISMTPSVLRGGVRWICRLTLPINAPLTASAAAVGFGVTPAAAYRDWIRRLRPGSVVYVGEDYLHRLGAAVNSLRRPVPCEGCSRLRQGYCNAAEQYRDFSCREPRA